MNLEKSWQQLSSELVADYSRFNVSERVLLTGHSHQAWPDVAFEGQMQAIEDAAQFVDDKWEQAFLKADRVRRGFANLLSDTSGEYVLGTNTQELLVRWLSGLPLHNKVNIVTTEGEFHSMRRLLDRLNETHVEVVKVATQPVATLAERMADKVNENTAAVMFSYVLFQTGQMVPAVAHLAKQLNDQQIPLLVDVYHAVNVLPLDLKSLSLEQAFLVGGGYKYCQLGEGNCFLRVPKDCDWRPLVTGWYAEFASLAGVPDGKVRYGKGRWAFEGSTYDPTSHYRAASVFDFFAAKDLSPDVLHRLYRGQQHYLLDKMGAYQWPDDLQMPDRDISGIGGFLVMSTQSAGDWVNELRKQRIFLDNRGHSLRIGPAPYVTESQLDQVVEALNRLAVTNN